MHTQIETIFKFLQGSVMVSFLIELVQVLYQEITVVALGALVPFLVVELNLAKTMDLLIHMADQTLLVRIVLLVLLLLPNPTGAIWQNPSKGELQGHLPLHAIILEVSPPACRLQYIFSQSFPFFIWFALWNSSHSTTCISCSITKVPVFQFSCWHAAAFWRI